MPTPVDVVLDGRELVCVAPVASMPLSRLATSVLAPLTFSAPFAPPLDRYASKIIRSQQSSSLATDRC